MQIEAPKFDFYFKLISKIRKKLEEIALKLEFAKNMMNHKTFYYYYYYYYYY